MPLTSGKVMEMSINHLGKQPPAPLLARRTKQSVSALTPITTIGEMPAPSAAESMSYLAQGAQTEAGGCGAAGVLMCGLNGGLLCPRGEKGQAEVSPNAGLGDPTQQGCLCKEGGTGSRKSLNLPVQQVAERGDTKSTVGSSEDLPAP